MAVNLADSLLMSNRVQKLVSLLLTLSITFIFYL